MRVTDFNSFQQFMNGQDIASRFGVSRIGVFGSLARGDKEIKDIDILIEEENPDFKKLMGLRDYLEQLLGLPVDVVVKRYADPVILHRAMKDVKYATLH
jgi:predicted nucleotidyltransferase